MDYWRLTLAFWVYIIQSENTGRYYCGHSSDPNRRLRQHNDPEYRLSKTTKRFEGPWKLIWSQDCQTRGEAMKLEKTIKKRGIGRYLESLSRPKVPREAV
ncbi:MAG: GIY-YIG nuclease family protein [Pseudomonadota bacterium]